MIFRKLTLSILLLPLAILFGCSGGSGTANVFEVLIENISDETTLIASNGFPVAIVFSPAIAVIHNRGASPLFRIGEPASDELRAFAEDADPNDLIERLRLADDIELVALARTVVEREQVSVLLPDESYRLLISTRRRDSALSLATMFFQSNDVFLSLPQDGIPLFNEDGTPIQGDITAAFTLLDAGTEVNQEPGLGPDQAPRQEEPGQGEREEGVVRPVDDGFTYPEAPSMIRITITPVGEFD